MKEDKVIKSSIQILLIDFFSWSNALNENNIPNGKKTIRNGNDILKITVIKLEIPSRKKLYKNSVIPCSSI